MENLNRQDVEMLGKENKFNQSDDKEDLIM